MRNIPASLSKNPLKSIGLQGLGLPGIGEASRARQHGDLPGRSWICISEKLVDKWDALDNF